MTPKIKFTLPDKLGEILNPYPYKVLYGGRGGAKSRSIAKTLLLKGSLEKKLILCTRELQKSIQDSVHRVLTGQIKELGLEDFYEVQKQTIIGKNGTEFIFNGIRNNATAIKSMEGVDHCWCEEAESITEESWDILIPTIRKEGAEIWVSFNPDDELDDTWNRWVINPPEGSLVININYWDNPWFPYILRKQMEEMKKSNHNKYLHVWGGEPNADYEDSIIKPEWFDATIDAHNKIKGFEPMGLKVVSFDPADDGSDAKAIAYRHGSIFYDVKQWLDGDITDAIPIAFDKAEDVRADFLIYDSIGIGASIKVALKARNPTERIQFLGFGGGDSVDDPDVRYDDDRKNKDTFKNKRAQYYWHLRDRFEKTYLAVTKGIYTNPDNMISFCSDIKHLKSLRSELCKIKRKRNIGTYLTQIESKQDMIKDGRKSPNMADSLMMSFATTAKRNKKQRKSPQPKYSVI